MVDLTGHEGDSNIGRIPVSSRVPDWSTTSAPTDSWQFCQSSYRLLSVYRAWSSLPCTSSGGSHKGLIHRSSLDFAFSSAASETESPRRNIAKAVRRVFWRILIFYARSKTSLCIEHTILFVCRLLVSSSLVCWYHTTTRTYCRTRVMQLRGKSLFPNVYCLVLKLITLSPYVIAINRAGIQVLPHIINAAVFTSAFSAGNSYLYTASRILFGLALRGQAPKIFGRVTKAGLPLISVAFCVSAVFARSR